MNRKPADWFAMCVTVDRFRKFSTALTKVVATLVIALGVGVILDLSSDNSKLLGERYYDAFVADSGMLEMMEDIMWAVAEDSADADEDRWQEQSSLVLDSLADRFPQLVGVVLWETKNHGVIGGRVVELPRDDVRLVGDSSLQDLFLLNDMWREPKTATGCGLSVSDLETLPLKPYLLVHLRLLLDDSADAAHPAVRAAVVLYSPTNLSFWYFSNLFLILGTLFALRRVVEIHPRPIMFFCFALANMLLAYFLRVIPTACVPFSPMMAHQAALFQAMIVPLMPDVPFFIMSALLLRIDDKSAEGGWQFSWWFVAALFAGYWFLQLPQVWVAYERYTGALGLFSSPELPLLKNVVVEVLPNLFNTFAVVFVGWHLAGSHHRLHISTIGQKWPGKSATTVFLFLLFLPWAFVQLFYLRLPHELVFSTAFFTKAIALSGLVVYGLLQLFNRTLEGRSVQIDTARYRLRKSILGDAILISLNAQGQARLESQQALMLHPKAAGRILTLDEVVYFKVDRAWIRTVLNLPDKSLYGTALHLTLDGPSRTEIDELSSPDGDDLLCLVDIIPDLSDGFTHLLIARPFDRILLDAAVIGEEIHRIRNHIALCRSYANWLKYDCPVLIDNDNCKKLEKGLKIAYKKLAPDQVLRIDDRVSILCDVRHALSDAKTDWDKFDWEEKYRPSVVIPELGGPKMVRADKRHLTNIIFDALHNVAKKAKRCELDYKLEVTVKVEPYGREGRRTVIIISDSGQPFRKDVLDRFSRKGPNIPLPSIGEEDRRRPKGLQWAYFFSRVFGGKMWVENAGGGGDESPTVFIQLWNMEV